MKERLQNFGKSIGSHTLLFLRWLILGVLLGVVGGLIGTLFSKSVAYVTNVRTEYSWLVFLLPLGGLVSVALYKLCRLGGVGTNQVFESVRKEKTVSPLLAPAVFVASCITHLLGGSAGREGAALQLGGSVSALFAKIFRLDEKSRHIITMCGMGAFFSAIFGTPLGAFVFAIEVVSVGHFCSAAIFPGLISSATAFFVAHSLGAEAERFPLTAVPELSLKTMGLVLLIAMIGALVSILFCHSLHYTSKIFKKWFQNEYLRIAVGGVLIALLTLAVGTDYNGGGIDVMLRIFETGDVRYEAFALKIIFTAITVAAGFKGGEIIPTLFIGATLGGALGTLLGLSPAFGAAVGIAALFCGVTNCPIATIILCIEMFGAEGSVCFALAAITSFLLSGNVSLYTSQRVVFSKWTEQLNNDGKESADEGTFSCADSAAQLDQKIS